VQGVRTRGYNTDADAIVRSLREDLNCEPRGADILLLGAGGAGRVAALKLAAEGARRLWLVNRTESKAEKVAEEIRGAHPGVEVALGYPTTDTRLDLILNATSLGLRTDDPSPLDEARFAVDGAKAVYDMVYRPERTKLLQTAQRADCRVADGTGMLLWQGVKALEIWCGQTAPAGAMRDALNEHLNR